MFNKIYIFM